MFLVMGATGHVGSTVIGELRKRELPAMAITHNAAHIDKLRRSGADVVLADLHDTSSFNALLKRNRRAFLLNPPADIKTDTDEVERASVRSILAALDNSGLEKVVAESSAGAQPGERLGDCNVLWDLEQGLKRTSIPAAINRAPYYMSNYELLLDTVRNTGTLPTMYPADLKLPMAAPDDLGRFAAERLISSVDDIGIKYVEGPERYSSRDVARAFERALGRSVDVVVTPHEKWKQSYRHQGFSEPAAESYTSDGSKSRERLSCRE